MDFPGTTFTAREASMQALRQTKLSSNPGGVMAGSANLLFMDGAAHVRLRAVVREVISRLEPMPEPVLADIARIVDGLGERAEIDLVADFGHPVAAVVAAAVLAVEEELTPELLSQITGTVDNLNVWLGEPAPAGSAMHRVVRFFLKATPVPGGGLDRLRNAARANEITEDELLVTPVMLTHAAFENSRNFLAAAALRIAEPGAPAVTGTLAGRLASGQARPGAVRDLVNEICPTRHVMRRATEPTEVAGTPVGPDEGVAIHIGPPNGLAFGTGPHSCPGIQVALAEAQFALARIAPLLASGWQVVDVQEKNHFVFHGLTRAVIRREKR